MLKAARSPHFLVVLPLLALAACTGSGEERYYSGSRLGRGVAQPPPTNYRADLIAFMRTYVNDPSGIREAGVTEPFQKDIGGLRRYVVCVRYGARDFNGRQTAVSDRAALFLDGRFDQLLDRPGDTCAGQAYSTFPELERLGAPAR